MGAKAASEGSVLTAIVALGAAAQVLSRCCQDQILQLRELTGDFGEIVYAGMDWVDPKLAKRSMELMATEVMPRVNRAIADEGNAKKVA